MNNFVRKLSATESELDSSRSSTPLLTDERASKRIKKEDAASNADSEELENSPFHIEGEGHSALGLGDDKSQVCPTDVERALPPTGTQEEAEEAYEEFKSSQQASQASDVKEKSLWVKGRRSIYVDAFALALDTVLDEEKQLFNVRELQVFQYWRDLHYEAQYL